MTVTTLHRPTHRETLDALSTAFERGELVTLFGRCTVEYEGRAESHLGPGDRLVVLKPDGTALVHTDTNRTPVNWQPPGCEHRASVRDGRLRVTSTRSSPDERLDVRFERVHQCSRMAVRDEGTLELEGSEEDLRQHVLANPERVTADFAPEATERETAAGPVDVFGTDGEGRPVAVELKRRRVGPDAVGQLRRYVDALAREFGDGADVRGVLVSPSVTDRARRLLAESGLEHVALDPTTGRAPDAAAGEGADGTRSVGERVDESTAESVEEGTDSDADSNADSDADSASGETGSPGV